MTEQRRGNGANDPPKLPSAEFDFFIAHASADTEAAESLYERLRQGYKVFLDSKSLVAGANWHEAIGVAQRRSSMTVVLVSENTGEAFYQQSEIVDAIRDAREHPQYRRVVPVYLSARLNAPPTPYGLGHLQSLFLPDASCIVDVARALRRSLHDLLRDKRETHSARQYIEVTHVGRRDGEPASIAIESPAVSDIEALLRRLEIYWELRSSKTSVLFADIDNFSGINVRYGRNVGDKIIEIVDGMFREYFVDGVAERMRMDEYVASTNSHTLTEFQARAERLCHDIAFFAWPLIANDLYVHTSIGIVTVLPMEQPREAVLRAIHGCRRAKQLGGNRVEAGPIALPKHLSHNIDDYSS